MAPPIKFASFPAVRFLSQAWIQRGIVLTMATRDFESRYIGTLGGTIWAIIQPLATIVVFYLVFAIGFRVQSPTDTSFILWFVTGLAPWFLFNDTLQAIAGSVTGQAYLVKKTVFPTEVLAFVKIASALPAHVVFLLIILVLLGFFHVPFGLERLLLLYYMFCTSVLLLGLGWMLSALQVFYRDIGQALPILLNVWFWATPIVWPEQNIPDRFRDILNYNPIYYVVSGYRDSLIYPEVRWPGVIPTVSFWCFALAVMIVGTYIFDRLKPEFADVV